MLDGLTRLMIRVKVISYQMVINRVLSDAHSPTATVIVPHSCTIITFDVESSVFPHSFLERAIVAFGMISSCTPFQPFKEFL